MKILVVTAVDAEREAIAAALPAGAPVVLVVGGAGPAAAAAATATALDGVDLVLGAGIAGGFAPLSAGEIAVAATIVFADLGADTPDGFAPLSMLGFGRERYEVEPKLSIELADRTGGRLGTILTVATVTGTAERADQLRRRFPDAVAEAMEGAGVAAAATARGVPFGEIRAVSNAVGPRARDAWQVPRALAALGAAVARAVS